MSTATESCLAFLAALRTQKVGGTAAISSMKRKILTHPDPAIGHGQRCAYCGCEIGPRASSSTTWAMDHIIPIGQGGPNIGQNMRPACYRCNYNKGTRDWLLFGCAVNPEDIKQARLAMLALVPNHLVRDPSQAWKRDDVHRVLGNRWQHPRSVVFAACIGDDGFVGWPKAGTTAVSRPQRAAIEATGAERHESLKAVAYRVPRPRFLQLVWDLIDCNAWVRRLDIPGQQDATPADDPELARWSETYRNVGEIVLRRGYVPRINGRCPHRPEGVPAPKSYPTKPLVPGEVRKPRAPRGTGRRALAAQRKVEQTIEWLRRKPAKRFYEPGPRERAYLEGLTPERERLLDLAWRSLAYEAAGVEMPRRRKVRKVRAAKSYFHGRRGRTERLAQRAAEDRAWEREHGKPEGWLKR